MLAGRFGSQSWPPEQSIEFLPIVGFAIFLGTAARLMVCSRSW